MSDLAHTVPGNALPEQQATPESVSTIDALAREFDAAEVRALAERQADGSAQVKRLKADKAEQAAQARQAKQASDIQREAREAAAERADADTGADEPQNAEPVNAEAFAALGLAPELVQAVADLGFSDPTPVQAAAIPKAMPDGLSDARQYADLMVSSQTGSGKTAAFLLPVLNTLLKLQNSKFEREKAEWDAKVAAALANGEEAPKKPRRKNPLQSRHFQPAIPGALILCPTRELAQQVANDAIDLVRHCRGLRIATVVGGMPYQLQVAKLQNANLVVATPGRLLDLERSGQLKLNEVEFLVMDEADRMLDLGFADDLEAIHQLTGNRRQTMMFSATFAPRIQDLAMRVMHEGGKHVQRIQIDTPQEAHANIEQSLMWADNSVHKRQLLDHWLRDPAINQAIVFASTQIECDGLAEDLQQTGFAAVALHGALSQALRNRRLRALREGKVQILVATDVAARGIDVPTITHVFNFGLPMKAEDYTHRIGRTGRAGRDGIAVTFAEIRDRGRLFDIERYTRQAFQIATVPGLEPTLRFPVISERNGGRAPGGKGRHGGGRGRPGGDRGGRGAPRFDDRRNGPRMYRGEGDFNDQRAPRADRHDGPREGGFDQRRDFGGGRFEPRGNRGAEGRGDFRAPRPEGRFDPRGDARREPRFDDRAPRFDRAERPARGDFDDRRPATRREGHRDGFGSKPAAARPYEPRGQARDSRMGDRDGRSHAPQGRGGKRTHEY
ncbi:hypothetical protein CCO03_10140 [Comamonas serinivorans]|uniref:DEAD/DEAH box helicase n=1 Tax=Comamonas serinivorans TaxID=1082851 RepID=A0A1Y0EMW2_9BURK|nr:DEAD/DEAH box helicase [Comamonas serinivorans]ARU04995.1 hypothetical protein CCO03_10140 [Comamonas serinivorans]